MNPKYLKPNGPTMGFIGFIEPKKGLWGKSTANKFGDVRGSFKHFGLIIGLPWFIVA